MQFESQTAFLDQMMLNFACRIDLNIDKKRCPSYFGVLHKIISKIDFWINRNVLICERYRWMFRQFWMWTLFRLSSRCSIAVHTNFYIMLTCNMENGSCVRLCVSAACVTDSILSYFFFSFALLCFALHRFFSVLCWIIVLRRIWN